ncbi:hypothetical protein D3C83_234510 [compost metagenome]
MLTTSATAASGTVVPFFPGTRRLLIIAGFSSADWLKPTRIGTWRSGRFNLARRCL